MITSCVGNLKITDFQWFGNYFACVWRASKSLLFGPTIGHSCEFLELCLGIWGGVATRCKQCLGYLSIPATCSRPCLGIVESSCKAYLAFFGHCCTYTVHFHFWTFLSIVVDLFEHFQVSFSIVEYDFCIFYTCFSPPDVPAKCGMIAQFHFLGGDAWTLKRRKTLKKIASFCPPKHKVCRLRCLHNCSLIMTPNLWKNKVSLKPEQTPRTFVPSQSPAMTLEEELKHSNPKEFAW